MDYYRAEGERFLADRWREVGGKPSVLRDRGFMQKAATQWSPDFEAYVKKLFPLKMSWRYYGAFEAFIPFMKNRLLMGACRYGLLNDPDKPKWDRKMRYILELRLFDKDLNGEHLIDALNMLLLEFEEGDRDFVSRSNLASIFSREIYQGVIKPIYTNEKVREI